jgi:hypothetical protein
MQNLSYFSTESIGKTRSYTPEGFLLVTSVPVARTGVQDYYEGEGIPVQGDSHGKIRIQRDASEVFHPNTIASFNGKPITNDHPTEKVTPDNFKKYSVGTVLNPRRGEGREFDSDYLYADLLITDKDAIQDVLNGKVEVSCGYDAEYEMIRPGEGRQHFIIGNHVALVDKGRCGARCAVGDSMMTTRKNPAWADALEHAFKTQNDAEFVQTVAKMKELMGEVWLGKEHQSAGYNKVPSMAKDEKEDEKEDKDDKDDWKDGISKVVKDAVRAQLSTFDSRINSIERAVAILATRDEEKEDEKEEKETKDEKEDKEDEKEDEKEDDDKKESKDAKVRTGDSSSLRASFQELISRAETLAPGIRLPTFDAKAPAKMTTDAMCKFRRRVLDEAMKEDDTKAAILGVNDGVVPKLSAMSCDSVTLLFNGASNTLRQAQRQAKTNPEVFNMTMKGIDSPAAMAAAMNKSNKSFWDKQTHRN